MKIRFFVPLLEEILWIGLILIVKHPLCKQKYTERLCNKRTCPSPKIISKWIRKLTRWIIIAPRNLKGRIFRVNQLVFNHFSLISSNRQPLRSRLYMHGSQLAKSSPNLPVSLRRTRTVKRESRFIHFYSWSRRICDIAFAWRESRLIFPYGDQRAQAEMETLLRSWKINPLIY